MQRQHDAILTTLVDQGAPRRKLGASRRADLASRVATAEPDKQKRIKVGEPGVSEAALLRPGARVDYLFVCNRCGWTSTNTPPTTRPIT